MEAFELIQDSYEVTHYVREYGNTENEDLWAQKPFDISSWRIVSESNGGQWSESPVDRDNDVLLSRIV
jgi:hypothetical protein